MGWTAAGILVASAALAGAYRHVWKAGGRTSTPAGFGVVLAPALLTALAAAGAPAQWLWAGAVILIATLVYWIDDLRGLSARLRLAVAFVTGSAVAGLTLADAGWSAPALVAAVLAGGAACVALTQVTNFYDGADLNLATTIALLCGAVILTASPGAAMAGAIGLMAALLPFAALNARPRTLYLGDSGSFATAAFAVLCAAAWLKGRDGVDPIFALPLALPTLDAFYVFCIRIIEKHDLLTRNYLHLYQRLQRTRPGLIYLLPQVVFLALAVGATLALRAAGMGDLVSVIAAAVGVIVPGYFLTRRIFLPPHQRETVEAPRLRKFCVVGLGGHARTKLIPALVANGQEVVAVVTTRPENAPAEAAAHPDLETALAHLTKDVAFVIATPPSAHDAQVIRVLEAGHDVIVEKPAFVDPKAAARAAELAIERKRVLVEGFMHRHTPLHAALTRDAAEGQVRKATIRFLIPEMPAGTFRQGGAAGDSVLYDVGAYVISLVQDLGLDPACLGPDGVGRADRIRLTGRDGEVEIDADFGLGSPYENTVTLTFADGRTRTYAPFFYGRPGPRRITEGDATTETEAADAFQAMLGRSVDDWTADQAARLEAMVRGAEALARLNGAPSRRARSR